MKEEQKEGHYALCLKEFKFAFSATMIYILASCALCYLLGYGRSGTEVSVVGGVPVWVLVGIVIPWILIVALTLIYGNFIMKGDEE